MNFNAATIQRFFQCFAGGDFRGMQACLHPAVEFRDIGFDLTGKKQVGAMWHMICEKGTRIMFRDIRLDDQDSTGNTWLVHWECNYEFAKEEGDKPRPIHNKIDSRFTFAGDGLICIHHDECDFHVWAAQALGEVIDIADKVAEKLHMEFLRSKVREKAQEKLAAFIKKHPEYA